MEIFIHILVRDAPVECLEPLCVLYPDYVVGLNSHKIKNNSKNLSKLGHMRLLKAGLENGLLKNSISVYNTSIKNSDLDLVKFLDTNHPLSYREKTIVWWNLCENIISSKNYRMLYYFMMKRQWIPNAYEQRQILCRGNRQMKKMITVTL